MSSFEVEFMDSGPGILLAVFGSEISEKTNGVIRAFCRRLEAQIAVHLLDGVTEWVPAYCSVTIYYDPFAVTREKLVCCLQSFAEQCVFDADKPATVYEVPVCYEEAFAPDMEQVMAHSGLSRQEVIELHTKNPYLVYMLGFLPGFVYLGGMDQRLNTPRLPVPRTKIPAGSVAIGGAQTGIYPVDSPGGWQIIGKTPLALYDPRRYKPVLFKAGDKIKFVPISADEFHRLENEVTLQTSDALYPSAINTFQSKKRVSLGTYTVTSGIKVLNGGVLTTVQDEGRFGYQKDGFCVSGAMDLLSYRLANSIAGNDPDDAVLETTFAGPELKFTLDTDFVITGANQNPLLNDKAVPLYTRIHALAGSVLSLGIATQGMRSYIAFTGGIVVPKLLGSRSTSLKYQLGGYCGRKLLAGDELAIGAVSERYKNVDVLKGEMQTKLLEMIKQLRIDEMAIDVVLLHVVPGPQYDAFTTTGVKTFATNSYTVSPESDRMGYRLSGPKIESVCGTDIISDGIAFGSVQIPSSGMPIVMMADHQTAGGYAKIATVVQADLPFLAQCKPGAQVRFSFVTQKEALVLLREQEVLLRMVQELMIDSGGKV
jgi:KipI family sensor histidine kinase inhibitor